MKTKLLVTVVCSLLSASAFAADAGSGTITFKGEINSGACSIKPADVNKEVPLGSVSAAALNAAGKQGPKSPFTLELVDCQLANPGEPASPYSKVKVNFSGSVAGTGAAANLWRNDGSATGVGVRFEQADGTAILPNSQVTQDLREDLTVISLAAQVEATDKATPGNVKSVANYILSYE